MPWFLLVLVAALSVGCADLSKPPRQICNNGYCTLACASNADCDDGNACNGAETCNQTTGKCEPGTPLTCDDGNPCNGTETCDATVGCTSGPAPDCDDGNDCTTDTCDTAMGCTHAVVADGTVCANGAGTAGVCNSGSCQVTCTKDADCDDHDPCNGTETCDTSSEACLTGTPPNCDDGNPCNGTETCAAGVGCQSGTAPTCNDGNPCTADSCDPASGCQHSDVPDDTACTNGAGNNGLCKSGSCSVMCTKNSDCKDTDVCNGTETCDISNGTCRSGTPLDCSDGNDCTADSCDPTSGCRHSPVADNTPCVDAVSHNGLCNTGTCVVSCYQASQCDDNNPCNGTETCDTSNGTCQPGTALACNDGNPCNGTETCVLGVGCQSGTAPSCDDGNPCTADGCNSTSGCTHTSMANGTPCTNGAGNSGQCQSGQCIAGCTSDADCNDNNVCNGIETCDTSTGKCQNGTPLTCDDGNVCNGMETCDPFMGCQFGTALDCNDNNSCTKDSCDPASGCSNTLCPLPSVPPWWCPGC